MNEQPSFVEAAVSMRAYLNTQNREALLRMCRNLLGAAETAEAAVTAIDTGGLNVRMSDGDGIETTGRIAFDHPAADAGDLHRLLVALADRADPPDGIERVATARVATDKASRYLKALCNHFDRKAEATYDDNSGRIRFTFGECEMTAEDGALALRVSADSDGRFRRVRDVVADHLVRFASKEELRVEWDVLEPVGLPLN